VKDAHDLIELLTERYDFERGNIREIFNPQATKANIYNAFRDLAQRITPTDNLLLYFSGHGEYDKIWDQGYWIPVDAEVGRYDQYIPNSEIKTFLSGIKSHHTFLMADACFAGTLFAKSATKNIPQRYYADPSRWGLTAGRNEIVSDGKPGDNSPFAESLLYRLRQNTDALGVQALCAYVTEYVQAKTNQTPIGEPLKVEGHKNGQFVFYVKQHEAHDWEAAQRENTVTAYARFRQQHPNSTHAAEARQNIKALEEKEAWKKALRWNKISYYEDYIEEYPTGKYAAAARQKIKDFTSVDLSAGTSSPVPPSGGRGQDLPGFAFVRGGSFQMGDQFGDGTSDEKPVHTITVSDFYLSKNEVTFDEYDAFCAAIGRTKPADEGWGRGKRPVINIDWYDAVEYCNWRSEQDGLTPAYDIEKRLVDPTNQNKADADAKRWYVQVDWTAKGYRLPTEAEWEYAAREGGAKVRFGNGKDIASPLEINFDARESYKKSYSLVGEYRRKTLPVGSFKANRLGLHDMSGNVWEWCWDWYDEKYYSESNNSRDPQGSTSGTYRVVRGGSWDDYPINCRAAYRYRVRPTNRNDLIGFRVVRH
jgi:formylglycine-generating enzyme required for sulfatase activity